MKEQLIVRIEENLKKRLKIVSRREGQSMSEKVIELVEDYVSQNDFPHLVDRVWEKISDDLRGRGFRPENVGEVIEEARRDEGERNKR